MKKHCGYIGIIGCPNVGKSTLLNRLLGHKVSITSRKPQTTREQILGIKSTEDTQFVFVDTPGIHFDQQARYANRMMNRAALSVLNDVDVLLWMVDASHLSDDDRQIMAKLATVEVNKLIVVLNKIDKVEDQEELMKLTANLAKELPKAEFVPVCARTGKNFEVLLKVIAEALPEQDFIYPEDMVTDRSEKFYATEILREKLMRYTGKELPYTCQVEIDTYEQTAKLITIHATIWVEKEGHKAIIIGKDGEHLKLIGQEARLDLEKFWDKKVFLKLWVKLQKPGFVRPVPM